MLGLQYHRRPLNTLRQLSVSFTRPHYWSTIYKMTPRFVEGTQLHTPFTEHHKRSTVPTICICGTERTPKLETSSGSEHLHRRTPTTASRPRHGSLLARHAPV